MSLHFARPNSALVLGATFFLVLMGCSKEKSRPALEPELKQETSTVVLGGPVKTFLPLNKAPSAQKVVTEVKVRKAALLGRTFNYGGSLQFGAEFNEEKVKTALPAIALGYTPAEFVIVDNNLRLVSDHRSGFESDINHPSRLIHEFPILRQDDEFLTFRADRASPILETGLYGEQTQLVKRASWIRSFEFSSADELFLIQSSVEFTNGNLFELMETITPRERVVPAEAKPIYDDSSLNPLADRFQFLNSGTLYLDDPENGRVQTRVAQRFWVKEGEPARWWVTRNIPEENIPDVKNGVEAWNRYSRAMGKGDLLRFEGLLPENVAVGDPRYNVIVWDNVAEADSAYESQAADPFTGIQTHSLIYLPSAWVTMGKDYWEYMSNTEESAAKEARLEAAIKGKRFLGRRLPVNCIESSHRHLHPHALESPEEFGRNLLKATLFHEVGHALGLGHNFKGSLSFELDAEKPLHSHSIMDYNLYNEDSAAFNSLDSSDGMVFEYDRQIVSVLYNEGKDIRDTDKVLASCGDDEADSRTNGVDPLCVRYDIGSDPTLTAGRSLLLLSDRAARLGRMTSLPASLARMPKKLPEASTIPTDKEAKAAVQAFAKSVRALVTAFTAGGGNSLANALTGAMKSLWIFQPGILPASHNEDSMRERAATLLEQVGRSSSLPEPSRAELASLRTALIEWLLTTPALSSLSEQDRAKRLEELLGLFDKEVKNVEDAVFTRLRTSIARNLKFNNDAPLGFVRASTGPDSRDGEEIVIKLLEEIAGPTIASAARPVAERTEAVKSLLTFAKVPLAKEAIGRVKESLAAEIAASRDARVRASLRKVLDLIP